ncbi:hypothetical protein, partial [Chloroflexus sp.]|uniref:hypothetical protein n=1 Tax=Chloroflexus sp. TaxID=1904827 RepID=UPI00404B6C04
DLTTNQVTPVVGSIVQITVTLTNAGCGQIGQPTYQLLLEPSSILAPISPLSITNYRALASGESDTASFQLQAIGVGEVALRATASFEVHLGYPGPAYWAFDSSQPLSATVPPTHQEAVVLQQAAYEIGCYQQVDTINDSTYQFQCTGDAGETIGATLERFTDEPAAQAAFTDRRDTLPLVTFRCYDAFTRAMDDPAGTIQHIWQAESLRVTTYHQHVTDTLTLSDAVYRTAVRNGLLVACDRVFVPVVQRP